MNGNQPAPRRNMTVLLLFLVVAVIPLVVFVVLSLRKSGGEDDFVRLTNTGKNLYDRGDTNGSINALEKALALNPSSTDAHLNLANAYLKANAPDKALEHAQAVLKLEPASGPAHYLAGCAYLRLGQAKPAAQELEQAKAIDRTINAVSFQLGRAYQLLGQNEQAAEQFGEVVKYESDHQAAHYTLSQVLRLVGKPDEASQALAKHQELMKGKEGRITDPAQFERCQYTQIRVPFRPEQPDPEGIAVTFVDNTSQAFGQDAARYRGPVAVIDQFRNGTYNLFVLEGNAFRILANTKGTFQPAGQPFPAHPDSKFTKMLVGDLNNDRTEDIIVLGDKASHLFKVATNGSITDSSKFSRMVSLPAADAVLADLDFSANLGLALIDVTNRGVRFFRNLSHPFFSPHSNNVGIPADLKGVRQVLVEDWNHDELLDLLLTRENGKPIILARQRGEGFAATNTPADWPNATLLASGDLNGDLRSDLVFASPGALVVLLHGANERLTLPFGGTNRLEELFLIDYDNDGWLDIMAAGAGLRVWRNRGKQGFEERTAALGLDKPQSARVATVWPADFDCDGDSDLLLTLADNTLRILKNEGGNKNNQLKLRLVGLKSNASGIGVKVEVAADRLRLSRRVHRLPIEIGVGKHQQIEAIKANWELEISFGDIKVAPCEVVSITESENPTGSCPYLYAWDGKGFRFVTDLLGASPAGLPISENRYIEADPEEYVWLGADSSFPPRNGRYVLQVTEELREVLYLDEAKLVAVDHPSGTEVHTTGKLLPGKPFPKHEIVTLHNPRRLLQAINHEGTDVTDLLTAEDHQLVSPTKLRPSQIQGLAEPHSVTLDFGPLDMDRPLVLATTGWLRFGGGTANVSASLNPDLPFPFPTLEAELPDGQWKKLDIVVGAPAGKTKRMIVDLTGRLPAGARRLRLATAFELHWDRIALLEKRDNNETKITVLPSSTAHLHWRGYSAFQSLPWYYPLTPDYQQVRPHPFWPTTPTGWCTRYGEIGELIAGRDNGLALLNGGDELTLEFNARNLPAQEGNIRDFFFYSVGWDKDANIHCKLGWQVDPLPWHGMDDQRYGEEPRPAFPSDALMHKHNTRWVGPYTFSQN